LRSLRYCNRRVFLFPKVEPLFLKGQTKTAINLSPIKIVKNPDGSMNRAALSGASLAKERREIRQQQAQEEGADDTKTGADRNDPMANKRENSNNIGASAPRKEAVLPEWKKNAFNSATSFGKITSLSMKQQRESLPIFKLRDTIIKAVDDNQVLVVIGDTGSGKVCPSPF
jgi:ATP-dependent RNA helicase DHX8/PRP22